MNTAARPSSATSRIPAPAPSPPPAPAPAPPPPSPAATAAAPTPPPAPSAAQAEQSDPKFDKRDEALPEPRRSYAKVVSTTDDRIGQVLSKLDLGQDIPPELYEVVARVLAFLYRMNQETPGDGK